MPTLAQQVRDAIRDDIDAREITPQGLASHLKMDSKKNKQRLVRALRYFRNRGELKEIRSGVYERAERTKPHHAPIQKKMWSIIRSRRTVTVADMIALTGAAESYAKEYLALLTRQRILRRTDMPGNQPSKYQMIADPVKMPVNSEKASRMRKIRAARKKAVEAIDKAAETMIGATAALAGLKTALDDMPEDDDE